MAYRVEDLTVNINTVDRPAMLEAALQSLLDTTPEGVSLQIVFNGTPAKTREATIALASDWRGPTRFEHLDTMLPIDESHNHALASIATPLVNFMGDDDVVLAERLTAMIDVFNTFEPEPAVVTSFARRIAGDVHSPSIGPFKDLGPTTTAEWQAFHATGQAYELLWPGAILRTDLLREIGGFEKPFAESFDNRIFSQMSFLGPLISLPERNFGFRVHQGSLSSSSWQGQNEIVRFVAACHAANIAGLPEPTYEEFQSAEAADPLHRKVHRELRDRSRIHFRKGGSQALAGERLNGVAHMAAAFALWPPAFLEKVRDQLGNRAHRRQSRKV